MPFTARIEASHRLGVATLLGAIDGVDFRNAMRALYEHPAWEPDFNALWDGRGLSVLLLQPEDVEHVLALTVELEARMGTGRAAFVMPQELHRMIAGLIIRRRRPNGRERKVFESMEPALAWLEVEGALDERPPDGPGASGNTGETG